MNKQKNKLLTLLSKCTVVLLISSFLLSGCKKDSNDDSLEEKSMVPIVMVHGLIGSGDTYELQMLRFASNGYPQDMLYTFEWNTLDLNNSLHIFRLNEFIDKVLATTGYEQVDLVGHSLGGVLVHEYSEKIERAMKVRNLVLLGAPLQDGPGGTKNNILPTLNIWSAYDRVVTSGANIKGAKNLQLIGKDHFQVASSIESFEAMYQFFRNRLPETTEIISQENPIVSGKVLSFGENITGEGATLEVYEVDANTGKRLNSIPDAVFSIDASNEWGPFQTKTGAYYEFRVWTERPGDRAIRFYKESFIRDNKNVIIRYSPPNGSLLKVVFDLLIPVDNDLAIVTYFNASQAVIRGRDELLMNDFVLSTALYAAANLTTVALFMFDVNDNGVSDGNPLPFIREIPALSVADFYFPVEADSTTTFVFNGRTLNVPGSRSVEEGICIAVFD
jgi:predicted alpha/beta hydrolase family esterase